MIPSHRFGIDLGGTKIELAALDAAGELCLRRRVATPVGNYEATLAAVATLVEDAERELGVHASVGVATPGSPSPLDWRGQCASPTTPIAARSRRRSMGPRAMPRWSSG